MTKANFFAVSLLLRPSIIPPPLRLFVPVKSEHKYITAFVNSLKSLNDLERYRASKRERRKIFVCNSHHKTFGGENVGK